MTKEEFNLLALSPIDGRYAQITEPLSEFFSEYALIKIRVEIEIKYLLFLLQQRIMKRTTDIQQISLIYEKFNLGDALRVKKIESETRHDVKSVEYFLGERLNQLGLGDTVPWIHFGLTSYDINDPAHRIMLKRALGKLIVPELTSLTGLLSQLSRKYGQLAMLGRTHGQAAVGTTLGKELAVFESRLVRELKNLQKTEFYGKFGGAVGNWNSLRLAFPAKNWIKLSKKFLGELGLSFSPITIQTAPAEDMVALFQLLQRINSILIDLNQDMWRYISDGWFLLKKQNGQVGSSTMPQKINPIDFENSEGNLILANGIFEVLSRKLPISRLQRDLSDSSVLRNIGVAFGHCLVGYKNTQRGLSSIQANREKILEALNGDWSILSEGVQTLLRKNGYDSAYEKISNLVKGRTLTEKSFIKLIDSLDVPKNLKKKLKTMRPENYLGYAKTLINEK